MQTKGEKPSQGNLSPTPMPVTSRLQRDLPSLRPGRQRPPSHRATRGGLRTMERNPILCDKWGLSEHTRNRGESPEMLPRPSMDGQEQTTGSFRKHYWFPEGEDAQSVPRKESGWGPSALSVTPPGSLSEFLPGRLFPPQGYTRKPERISRSVTQDQKAPWW